MGLTGWPSGTTNLGAPGEWNDIVDISEVYYVIEYDSISSFVNSVIENKTLIYPNPTTGILFVEGKNIQTIEIFDITDRKILSSEKQTLNLNRFEKGLYFVNIMFNNQSKVTRKIILE
ncbi:MAG: T9SS type A sorting domain-containing protein [Bacteroidetes bacterium]|jgi:hypothetical protein|nr:T9SS type A sorting domain-containing protein [Bacteroidota bacterium]MBT6685088.1 T9SS type A sorting domain-containing protein [Bacteroidota bacterium]MBT7142608.1 T9SS type A sorting domain-containing protein [Bacteroidota bacterium]MBT7493533.1 T9SS type A sorting domain-containing protein [Bacteroidota bacterium]